MSAVGGVSASLGPQHLAVFTASYRFLWMGLTLVSATAGAMGIQISMALGAGDVPGTLHSVRLGLSTIVAEVLGLAAMLAIFPEPLGRLFSDDASIIAEFGRLRIPIAAMLVWMNLAVALERVLIAAGRVRAVFLCGVVGSWGGQVPFAVLLTWLVKDVAAVYWGVVIGYAVLCSLLFRCIVTNDWEQSAREAKERSAPASKPTGDDQDVDQA
jgi:Na+-driven multidrug efflux pump